MELTPEKRDDLLSAALERCNVSQVDNNGSETANRLVFV